MLKKSMDAWRSKNKWIKWYLQLYISKCDFLILNLISVTFFTFFTRMQKWFSICCCIQIWKRVGRHAKNLDHWQKNSSVRGEKNVSTYIQYPAAPWPHPFQHDSPPHRWDCAGCLWKTRSSCGEPAPGLIPRFLAMDKDECRADLMDWQRSNKSCNNLWSTNQG